MQPQYETVGRQGDGGNWMKRSKKVMNTESNLKRKEPHSELSLVLMILHLI
jgi:hypothetical protein